MKLIISHSFKMEQSINIEFFQTIFPKTEKKLNSSFLQSKLKDLDVNGEMDKYRDIMDFFVCAVFPHFKKGCFDYYTNNGPLLKDIIVNKRVIAAYDTFFCKLAIPMMSVGHSLDEIQKLADLLARSE